MKISAAVLMTESDTFSTLPTGYNDFNVTSPEELRAVCRDIAPLDPYLSWQNKADSEPTIREIIDDMHPMKQAFLSTLTIIDQVSVKNSRLPVAIADQSDNPGGAPADAVYAMQWLFDNKIKNAALGIMYDPEVVKFTKIAGVGANISVRLGRKSCQTIWMSTGSECSGIKYSG